MCGYIFKLLNSTLINFKIINSSFERKFVTCINGCISVDPNKKTLLIPQGFFTTFF